MIIRQENKTKIVKTRITTTRQKPTQKVAFTDSGDSGEKFAG